MTFDQFLNRVDKVYYENEFELRYGQVLMNVLHSIWPDQYKKLSSGDYDCYYDDGTAPLTIEYLEKAWNDKHI
jgi:hypothetical protein